jgi:hypothetical protein
MLRRIATLNKVYTAFSAHSSSKRSMTTVAENTIRIIFVDREVRLMHTLSLTLQIY